MQMERKKKNGSTRETRAKEITEGFPEEVTLKLRLQIQDEWVGRRGRGGRESTPSRQGTDDAKPCRSC